MKIQQSLRLREVSPVGSLPAVFCQKYTCGTGKPMEKKSEQVMNGKSAKMTNRHRASTNTR